MKRFFILFLILFVAIPFTLSAQNESLFDKDFEFESGCYGGPTFRFTTINGDFTYLAGFGGAWIIDHRVTIGGSLFWLDSDIETTVSGTSYDIDMDYGGFDMGYVILPDRVVHLTVYTLVGGGEVVSENTLTDNCDSNEFFAVEPNIDVDLNVFEWFRISVGGAIDGLMV